jgi:hypothetical protein
METEDWGAIMEDVSESEIMDGSGLWRVTFSVNENGASAKSLKLWEDRIAAVNLVNGRLLTVCSEEFGDYEFRLLEIDRDGGQATVLNKNTGTLTNLTAAEDGTLIGQAGNTIVRLSETGEYLGMLDEEGKYR